MGNAPCSTICKTKLEQFDFPNIESIPQLDKNGFVIRIQSLYRRFISRKRLKRLLIEKLEKKRRIISSAITFKESWELYFKSRSEFEFSYEGLKTLKEKIKDYYSKFFIMKPVMQKTIQLGQIMKVDTGEAFKEEFKKWIFISMKKDYYLGDISDHIFLDNVLLETIDRPDEPIMIRKTMTSTCCDGDGYGDDRDDYTQREIINHNKAFKLSIEPKKENTPIRSTIVNSPAKLTRSRNLIRCNQMKFTKQPLMDNQRKMFELLTKKAIEKQRVLKEKLLLYEPKNNTIMLLTILDEIKELQDKKCSSISYKDNYTKVTYSGSYNSQTQKKEGLGSEYMIDSIAGSSEGKYKYCGTYLNNTYHGIGMLIRENGEMYYGEWRKGIQNGFGYYYSDNSYYIGFFRNNLYHGYGELLIKDKCSYYGNWSNGKQEGIGFYQYKTLNTYCGEFSDGRINGKGYFKWNEGQTYLGTWKNDQMNGYGEFRYNNGDVYKGYYKNDLKHGDGVYIYKNGMQLKGKWIKGNKEGNFYFTFPNNPMHMLIKYEDDIQLNR